MKQIKKLSERRVEGIWGSLARLGYSVRANLHEIGQTTHLMLSMLKALPYNLYHPTHIMQSLKDIAFKSLIIIMLAAIFIGMVLSLQLHEILSRYGQSEQVGVGVALSLFRQLGPVTATLLYIGCAGTAITSAVALKVASDQIASYEVMAIDPIKHELAPRLIASIILLPLLTIYFNVIALISAYYVAVGLLQVNHDIYWSLIGQSVFFYDDFLTGILRTIPFALIATTIALYEGYYADHTSRAIARATILGVIKSSLAILAVNFIFTSFQ